MAVLQEIKEMMGTLEEMELPEETAWQARPERLVQTGLQELIKLVFGFRDHKALTERMVAVVQAVVQVAAVDVKRVRSAITVPEMVDLVAAAVAKVAKAVRADTVPEVRLESILITTALMEIS
jgi:hypothetical protein